MVNARNSRIRRGKALSITNAPKQYALATTLVGSALLLSWVVQTPIAHAYGFLFVVASAAAAWLGGRKPGLFAALLSIIAAKFSFVRPIHGFAIDGDELPLFLTFCATILGVSWLSAEIGETEGMLREGDEHLRLLVDGAKDYAIFALDPKGYITTWNDGAQLIKGYAAEEIVGKHFSVFYTPEAGKSGHPQKELTLAAERGRFEEEGLRVRKDGSQFWASVIITARYDRSGKVTGFTKVTRDITERKLAEEVLHRTKEEEFRAALESVPDAVVIVDNNGQIVTVNKRTEKLFGYERDELAGKRVETLIPERARQQHARHRAGYNAEPRAREMGASLELYALHKDGGEFPVEICLSPIHTAEGLRVISAIRDVTERKRAEALLKQSKEESRALLESAPDAVLLADDQGKIILVNAQTEKLFGYDRGELLGERVEKLIPERARQEHAQHRTGYQSAPRMRAMGAGLELYALRKDGSEFPVEISLSPIQTADGFRILSTIRDVTERKRTEEILKQTRILDLAQVVIRNLDGTIVHWNVGAERLYGFKREEALGHVAHELFQTEFPELRSQIEERILRTGQWEGELVQRRRDGTRMVASSYWVLHRDAQGRPWRILEASTDITDRKRAEETAAAMNKELERQNAELQKAKAMIESQTQQIAASAKMSALGEMAGGVAHEINNPMGIIHARASDLKDVAEESASVPSGTVIETMEKICNTALRVTKITKGLRKFARNAHTDPYRSCTVREIVEDTLTFCQERLRQNSIELRLLPIDANLKLECRATEISQVLLNLLNNAFDAVQELSEKWIELETQDLGEQIEISVTDSGGGIPPGLQEKILEPFFSTKSVGKGTGLGLSISRGIVEAHGGQLVLATECKHTRFRFQVPKVQTSVEAHAMTSGTAH